MSTYKALLAFHVGNLLIRYRFDSEGDSREEMPSKSVLSPLSDEFAKTEAVYQEGRGFSFPKFEAGRSPGKVFSGEIESGEVGFTSRRRQCRGIAGLIASTSRILSMNATRETH